MISISQDKCVGCGSCVRSCPMGVLRMVDGKPAVLPGRRCIECLHCAAACGKKAVNFEGVSHEELYVKAPENETVKLIMSRRAIRKFSSKLPDREDVQRALDTAMYAPSGKNIHANQWTVLWGIDETAKATDMALNYCLKNKEEAPELLLLKIKGVNLVTCDAPCVIIGWSPDNTLNPVVDSVVAMSTVELLLKTKGISTCWGGYLNQITNKSAELQAEFGIPEGCHMRCALMVGYADRESYPNIPYRPGAKVNWVE